MQPRANVCNVSPDLEALIAQCASEMKVTARTANLTNCHVAVVSVKACSKALDATLVPSKRLRVCTQLHTLL